MRDEKNNNTSSTLDTKVLSQKNRDRYLRVFGIVALVVALSVAGLLRQHGVAMTHTETVLDCQYSGDGAHTHNDDCYDEDGNLVCPLEEKELHTHGDDCYEEEEVLVCGLEEGEIHAHTLECLEEGSELVCGLEETEGHEHSDECFDEDGELICGLEEEDPHFHTVDCYDGELVCGKQETEGHEHTDDCFDEDGELVCGLEEGEIHGHTDDCFDANDELICGKIETEGHVHTDDCYEIERKLVCDKEEVTEEHVHGPGCFKTIKVKNGAVAEDEDEAKSEDQVEDQDEGTATTEDAPTNEDKVQAEIDAMKDDAAASEDATSELPAQSFSQSVYNKDGKEIMRVSVEAPEGAFPKGTTMEVNRVKASDVEGVVSETMAEANDTRGIDSVQAVDIVFRNADGDEIEPLCPITVSMGSSKIAEKGTSPLLLHVDDKGKGALVDQLSDKQVADRALETSDDTIVFDSDAFSVYAIAYISVDYLSDSGELFEVTVTYSDDAQIPVGSTLKVTEFADESEEYKSALKAVVADMLSRGEDVDLNTMGASALDVSILNPDGKEIEPAAPVQVEMKIKALPGVEELSAVTDTLAVQHHVETNDGVVVETVFDSSTEASFVMATNEAVVAEGTVVDPESVDLSHLGASEQSLYAEDVAGQEEADEASDENLDVSFTTEVFSTFTVTWGNNNSNQQPTQLQISALADGKYVIYAKDAANGKYYALVPGTTLRTVEVTLSNGLVQYAGPENLYWDVNVETVTTQSGYWWWSSSNSYNYYEFSFTEGGQKYYLKAGNNNGTVGVSTTSEDYGSANTTKWQSYTRNSVDYIHTNDDTFLRCENGVFKVVYKKNFSEWSKSNVYFEKQGAGAYSGPHATIHYVDEAGNELTVVNGQPVNDVDVKNLNYLIYDIENYEYSYTYRNTNTNNNRIGPVLKLDNSKWKYTTSLDGENVSWKDISDGDDIYVVYKQKADVPQGGTPVPKVTGTKPAEPTVTKESTVNGDGTNTLALSVAGHTSVMEAEKLADVIVVFDVSGSMDRRIDSESTASGNQKSRLTLAKEATNALADALFAKNTAAHPELIRMGLITFSNTATTVQTLTNNKTTFKNAISKITKADGGTNWEYALQLANEMAVESDRATFVIFVTDGNPTFRQTRGVLNNSSTNDGFGAKKNNNYDIYNSSIKYYDQYHVYGDGQHDDWGRNYSAALVQAQSIVSHNKNFYTIGIYSQGVSNLTKLTTEAGAGADHSKTADSEAQLIAAFNDIQASIIALMGHSDIGIVDGITELTQTVQKSNLVNFAEDDFTYYRGHPATQEEVQQHKASHVGDMVWETWDPASERCAEAVYNTETGAVEWLMGNTFMPQDGYTYQVRFKVWPSQEAYDLIAGLNNGKYVMDDTLNVIRNASDNSVAYGTEYYNQISGTYPNYHLKTNDETSYTYCEATKSGDGVAITSDPSDPGHFPDVDPLDLTTRPLKIQKLWYKNHSASYSKQDTLTEIQLELYGTDSDGTQTSVFKTITLEKDQNWYSEDNFISYGLVTLDKSRPNANTEKVYETGHDFTLRELTTDQDETGHYFDLTVGTYRPMVINGTPTILELTEKPSGMSNSAFYYKQGGDEYYRLDGKVYVDTASDILVIATNSRRSLLDLNKEVVDQDGNSIPSEDSFEYMVTINVPTDIHNYETVEKYIFFNVRDQVNKKTLLPGEDYEFSGAEIATDAGLSDHLMATSGRPFTLKIKKNWNVRFLNLPVGTTYSIEEINIGEGYTFVGAEVSGTRWEGSFVNGEDVGHAVTMTGLPSNDGSDQGNTVIEGAIDYTNAKYNATYTNESLAQEVAILKVDEDGTPLSGADFALTKQANGNAFVRLSSFTTEDTAHVLHLIPGIYCVTEEKAPDGYVIGHNQTVFRVGNNGSVKLMTWSEEENKFVVATAEDYPDASIANGTVTVAIVNHPGVPLPHTGGIGTRLFTFLGTALSLFAGTGMVMTANRQSDVA